MVFKVPNKDQINFARSAFRDLLGELDKARNLKRTIPNTVLPELRKAVTKPGVDPRQMALNIVKTGRIDGKKVSANERREIATINDYIKNTINNAEDIGTLSNNFKYYKTPRNIIRYREGDIDNYLNSNPVARMGRRKGSEYNSKLRESQLTPQDLVNLDALNTMFGMKQLERGSIGLIPRGVMNKFLPIKNKQYSRTNPIDRFSDIIDDYSVQSRAVNKLRGASGMQDFKSKVSSNMISTPSRGYIWRPSINKVLEVLEDEGIPRTKEIDELIVTMLPEWQGNLDEFISMLKAFM